MPFHKYIGSHAITTVRNRMAFTNKAQHHCITYAFAATCSYSVASDPGDLVIFLLLNATLHLDCTAEKIRLMKKCNKGSSKQITSNVKVICKHYTKPTA